MAQAIKCDRCFRCFDPYSEKRNFCKFKNPVFHNAESLERNRVSKTLFEDRTYMFDEWVDLCADCAEAFELFMGGFDPIEEPGGK